jgi:hypothetical protein
MNHRKNRRLIYLVIKRTSLGLYHRLFQIRTTLDLEPQGRQARFIARSLGGDFLRRGGPHA